MMHGNTTVVFDGNIRAGYVVLDNIVTTYVNTDYDGDDSRNPILIEDGGSGLMKEGIIIDVLEINTSSTFILFDASDSADKLWRVSTALDEPTRPKTNMASVEGVGKSEPSEAQYKFTTKNPFDTLKIQNAF